MAYIIWGIDKGIGQGTDTFFVLGILFDVIWYGKEALRSLHEERNQKT